MEAHDSFYYLLRHVFLPPKLPQEDDANPQHESFLLDAVIQALKEFQSLIVPDDEELASFMVETVQHLQLVHNENVIGDIDVDQLSVSVEDVCDKGGMIVLPIRAQNAGVLISKANATQVHFEVFELSPANAAIMSTKGRLKRSFPATAVAVEIEVLNQPRLRSVISQTLADMSVQSVAGTKPQARKANQSHDEDRDSTHPKIVTELFIAFLSAIGTPVSVSSVGKNTREEVMWHDSLLPWRRSPLWLLIRVALQLLCFRRTDSVPGGHDSYKTFMVLFMSHILDRSRQYCLSADLIYIMKAKISRRLLKLRMRAPAALQYVVQVLENTDEDLCRRWTNIQQRTCLPVELSRLAKLSFADDTSHILPRLDDFIQSTTRWAPERKPTDFQARSVLIVHGPETLPSMQHTDLNDTVYGLHAVEAWVDSHLQTWLKRHVAEVRTTDNVSGLITQYHRLARVRYSDDPEALSLMLLTVLELWVACDRAAIQQCELLRDYDPGVPEELLQSLLLPSYHEMERLSQVEEYLRLRRRRAIYKPADIFTDFGTQDCFAVRYVEQSRKHQTLKEAIEVHARRGRVQKCEELRVKQKQYRELMNMYDQLECEYTQVMIDWDRDLFESRHQSDCQRCRCQSRAQNLEIQVHEWPLPQRLLDAKSTVFELMVPLAYGCWRDATVYLLVDVLHTAYQTAVKPRSSHPLATYRGLSSFYIPFDPKPRLCLLSQAKPHDGTHYRHKTIAVTTEADVCVNNGLRYRYYDNRSEQFTDGFLVTEQIAEELTLRLPDRSKTLQKYLFRPSAMPNGPPPNAVIASQSECPDHMSLDEYKALASLGLGYRIQWQNLLVQLAAPLIDFKKEETTLAALQCIHQVGPASDNVRRVSHDILQQESFTIALLTGVRDAHSRVKASWESSEAVCLFINLTLRVLALGDEDVVADIALALLTDLRRTAFGWVMLLRDKSSCSTDRTHRSERMYQVVEIALICVQSFDVDDRYLDQVMAQAPEASMLLQCSIIIHEAVLDTLKDSRYMTAILYRRWVTLSCRASQRLSSSIIAGTNSCLDDALIQTWPAYQTDGDWHCVAGTEDDWLTRKMGVCGSDSLDVHFNLVTGQLLVDGLPLSRLPTRYERSPVYHQLFGQHTMDVVPSPMPGMCFSTRTSYADHVVHFGFGSLGNTYSPGETDLRVQSLKYGVRRILIPSQLLANEFPTPFSRDFVHWYDVQADVVEFCPGDQAWVSSAANWRLVRSSGGRDWRLTRSATSLISMHSTTARAVGEILAPLEDPCRVHIVFHSLCSTVQVHISRLRLDFRLASGQSAMYSKQFRGMMVDANQGIGTLIGLRNKLVLRHHKDESRLLVIPEGLVSCSEARDHVSVGIDWGKSIHSHAFHLDITLGRLLDNGSARSKLYLAHIHALTSFPIPDPLTGKTGTEQALSILRSAHIRSFDQLGQDDIGLLERIASLTPERQYYPAHERVMQTVRWRSDIGFLAQHGMFAMAVQSILDSLNRTKVFYPGNTVQISSPQHVDWDLLGRDNIRSSTFRIAEFGAEQYTTDHDHNYVARDRGQGSPDTTRSFQMASFVHQDGSNLCFPLSGNTTTYLWEYLLPAGEIYGPTHTAMEYKLGFDAEWLREPFNLVAKHWTGLHHRLSECQSQVDKFALMIWFTTLAFTTSIDVSLLQTLASFFVLAAMRDIQPPSADEFKLHLGTHMSTQILRPAIQPALKQFRECPESQDIRTNSRYLRWSPKHHEFQKNQNQAVTRFVDNMMSQWPCQTPDAPTGEDRVATTKYLRLDRAMDQIRPLFQAIFANRHFFQYLEDIQQVMSRLPLQSMPLVHAVPDGPVWDTAARLRYVSVEDVFASPAPLPPPCSAVTSDKLGLLCDGNEADDVTSLPDLLDNIETRAASSFEIKYVKDLRDSHRQLYSVTSRSLTLKDVPDVDEILSRHQQQRKESVSQCFQSILHVLHTNNTSSFDPSVLIRRTLLQHFARISPMFLLEQLSRARWNRLSGDWRRAITHYAVCLTQLQQADRMLRRVEQRSELLKELQNSGHSNWDPLSQPETLLLEVESGIMLREIQQQIVQEMKHPRAGGNATVQLHMGEGKSSVIMPITAALLADTSCLVRVVVAKPLARQMFHTLTSKLGSLLNRKVYRMPFSRDLPLGDSVLHNIQQICRECMEEGGILLVQPEHLLSLKLMGLECLVLGETRRAPHVTQLLTFFDKFARDLVDESDEIFHVKFELVYSMGAQQPLELSPERWTCLQQVLEFTRLSALQIHQEDPDAVEVRHSRPCSFPRIRILHAEAQQRLHHLVAARICETGFHGFPIAQAPEKIRLAVQRYIGEVDLSVDDIARVEQEGPASLWVDATKGLLLLLRGLLAGGIVTFALSHKRWRVNYGRDTSRRPTKRLAVPFRAKDSPSPRSEFSHPDVVMTLTSLCHYYSGLNDDDLFITFSHLLKSDQAEVEYQIWVEQTADLPPAFRQLDAINLRDRQQCTVGVFPFFRDTRSVVDYFLSQIVFPKEMREFPQKLTASGWDIGEMKCHQTTGFSGTVDLSQTLPLAVTFERLSEQAHTNALVLECLLRPENSVAVLPPQGGAVGSDLDILLNVFPTMKTAPRVILDVGAQILDHDNLGAARAWLRAEDEEAVQAVVFFDNSDELCTLDRDDRIEALQVSPFARHLDMCLIYLDEAHTRGTDLELPNNYSAAVTLGPNVTKDRLIQACMRMRKLGQGQAVVFCVSQEIRRKILDCTSKGADASIGVPDVLRWAVSETFDDLRRAMPLWAVQGRRFERQDALWNGSSTQGKRDITSAQARKFLEDESLSLEHRYRPHARDGEYQPATSAVASPCDAIARRCRELHGLSWSSANLQEEQERELSPEIEQERHVERPAPATPANHQVHPDLICFVDKGRLSSNTLACVPAFQALEGTSAALHLDVSCFPHDLWVTRDFSRTIEAPGPNSLLDAYQRSVQWILVGVGSVISNDGTKSLPRVVAISPYEAQHLLPRIKSSRKVTLHLYAPRSNLGLPPLDRLRLYTVPAPEDGKVSLRVVMLLNLFAGQLYFDTYEEYVRVCDFLGIISKPARNDIVVAADGFIVAQDPASEQQRLFASSPVQCLRLLMSKIRKNGECIDKTHMGRLLGAVLLTPQDFPTAVGASAS